MHFIENEVYHIYNRGNNHQAIFFNPSNYQHFLDKVRKDWQTNCEILAWCLMPNHFHFMVQATDKSCIEIPAYGGKPMQVLARKIGLSLSSYAQYINQQHKTSGSLFQQKTKAKCISAPVPGQTTRRGPTVSTPAYIINCMHYIHQNPLKANLVLKMEDWPHSSFGIYTGLSNDSMCNKDLLLSLTDYDLLNFYTDSYRVIEENDIHFSW
jgi:REP element-mobilizing transposase RayT